MTGRHRSALAIPACRERRSWFDSIEAMASAIAWSLYGFRKEPASFVKAAFFKDGHAGSDNQPYLWPPVADVMDSLIPSMVRRHLNVGEH